MIEEEKEIDHHGGLLVTMLVNKDKHYDNIVIPPFSNKVVEFKPTLLSLIGSHPFAGMDHEDPYTHLSTFMELCSTMGASEKNVEAV